MPIDEKWIDTIHIVGAEFVERQSAGGVVERKRARNTGVGHNNRSLCTKKKTSTTTVHIYTQIDIQVSSIYSIIGKVGGRVGADIDRQRNGYRVAHLGRPSHRNAIRHRCAIGKIRSCL
jgi:hypothetical protein